MQRWKSHTCSIFRALDYADSASGENSTPKSLHQFTTEPHEETADRKFKAPFWVR